MRNNEDLLARRRRECTTGFILDPGLSWTQSGHHKGKLSKAGLGDQLQRSWALGAGKN